MSSSLHTIFLFIPFTVKNIRSTAEYFADRLFKAMKVSSGPGALLNYHHLLHIALWKAVTLQRTKVMLALWIVRGCSLHSKYTRLGRYVLTIALNAALLLWRSHKCAVWHICIYPWLVQGTCASQHNLRIVLSV